MNNYKKSLMIGIIAIVTLVLVFGGSFALINYSKTINNQSVVAGDIYMKYTNGKEIVLNSLTPRDTYDENSYFEFTIEGNNDSKKDIWYDVVLSYGDKVNGRTERIRDDLLRFRLVEIINDEEKVVVDNQSYNDLNERRIYVNTIKANTTEKVDITYRLYMWVASGTILVGNTEDAVYDIDTWNNQVYASINVTVNGDFNEKEVPIAADKVKNQLNDNNSVVDDKGIIYLSGTNEDINFNYVWYSGKLWRITQINPDGTMKMITEDAMTGIYFGETVDFENSWAYDWLNEDFLDTLYNYQDIIVTDAKWELTASYGAPYHPEPYKIVETAVGLLNTYEYYRSLEKVNVEKFQKVYLNNGYQWWLSSACDDTLESTAIYAVGPYDNDDGLWGGEPYLSAWGVRPAVVLKSDIMLEHSGTKNDPFIIVNDKKSGKVNEKLNNRLSGEYVKVDNKIYRIVGIENGTVKLTSVDYVRGADNNVLNKVYNNPEKAIRDYIDAANSNDPDYWAYYLNNNWLTDNLKKYLVEGTYYLGLIQGTTTSMRSYKNTICQEIETNETTKNCLKTEKIWNGYVGIPRIGEMFAYPIDGNIQNTPNMFLITPYSNDDYYIAAYVNGNIDVLLYRTAATVRPSINLKSSVKITGGDGMSPDTAYEIGL